MFYFWPVSEKLVIQDVTLRGNRVRILLLLVIMAFSASSASADTWALLVGIDDYRDARISDLDYTVLDVTRFYETLSDRQVCGITKPNAFLMTNRSTGENVPTHTNVIERLRQLSGKVNTEDTFIFYFSGHGMVRDGNHYLLSINSDLRSLDTLELTAIPLEKLHQLLSRIEAHQVLVLLDACRNDPEKGKGDADNLLTTEFARSVQIRPRNGTTESPALTATYYACSPDERAYECSKRQSGVFSFYLAEGLRGDAADTNGQVTLRSLATYVTSQVTTWSEEHLSSDKHQTPWLVSQGAADMVLVKGNGTQQRPARELSRPERQQPSRQDRQSSAPVEASKSVAYKIHAGESAALKNAATKSMNSLTLYLNHALTEQRVVLPQKSTVALVAVKRDDARDRQAERLLSTELWNVSEQLRFRMVDRDYVEERLQELDFSLSDLVDPAQAPRIGKALGASHLIVGENLPIQRGRELHLTLMETETGEIIWKALESGYPPKSPWGAGLASLVLPGAGQFMNGSLGKGTLSLMIASGAAAGTVFYHTRYSDIYDGYRRARTLEDIQRYYDDSRTPYYIRNALAGVYVAWALYTAYDAHHEAAWYQERRRVQVDVRPGSVEVGFGTQW